MGILDIFKTRQKMVTDDAKIMAASSVSLLSGTRGKQPEFSMRQSVKSFESWCYAAAMLNAQGAASVPLRLYVREGAQSEGAKLWRTRPVPRNRKAYLMGDGSHTPSMSVMKSAAMAGDFTEVVDAHPILQLLKKANAHEDGYGQTVLRMLYFDLIGNAYLHVVMDSALDIPAALFTMPAQYVTILPGKEALVDAYLYGVTTQAMTRFETDEVIHFKRPNPRDMLYGLGKVEAGWSAITLAQVSHLQDISMAQNMSRPDYVAIISGGASEVAVKRFEESISAMHQGVGKTGRMATIEGNVQLVPLGFPPKDIVGRDDTIEEISAVFGVPISMLKANDPNLASASTGYAMWRETTIAPMCRLDEETLNARLLPMFGLGDDAYLAYDNPVPSNRQADSAERAVAVAGGWRIANEARQEEGYEPLDDPEADKLHVNGQPLGGFPPVPMFGAPTPPAPAVEPKQLPAAEVKAITPIVIDESRDERMAAARVKIASMEAKAWEAAHQQPKIDALTKQLAEMEERTKSLDEMVSLVTDALMDEDAAA